MSSSGKGRGDAPPAKVDTGDGGSFAERQARQAREAYVEQVQDEITAIETKIDGMKASLAAKRDELKAARAAAKGA